MRRIFYILLAFIVFTACEDDKEYIPSPLNETHWDLISAEISKYDSEGTLVLHRLDDYQNGTWDKAALRRLYFYGDNAIFYIKLSLTEDGSPTNRYQEKKYSFRLEQQKFVMGDMSYILQEYDGNRLILVRVQETAYYYDNVRIPLYDEYKLTFQRFEPTYDIWDFLSSYTQYYNISSFL